MRTANCVAALMLCSVATARAQVVCPEGVDCAAPQPWSAEAIRAAAPDFVGCWEFVPPDDGLLRWPVFEDETAPFPFVGPVQLGSAETIDLWPDFNGVRHELAFAVSGVATEHAVYWLPNPEGAEFLIKWGLDDLGEFHLVLWVDFEESPPRAYVSQPGHHMGIVRRPYRIDFGRCAS